MQDVYNKFSSSSGISTDTRLIQPGQIFLALSGDNFNGNKFADEAESKGASWIILDDKKHFDSNNPKHIWVDDALQTYCDLAQYHREQFDIRVIGIAGSNGKTTTKNLIRNVLSTEKNVLATAENDNNQIGVAKTLLQLNDQHDIAVLELGSNHPGELYPIVAMAKPTHGLVTNIGKEHLEFFGSIEGVLAEETELYKFLELTGGIKFVPSDDRYLEPVVKGIYYGSSGQYVVTAEANSSHQSLTCQWNGRVIPTNLVGAYNVQNIAAAVAVGSELGITADNIVQALGAYQPQDKRSQLVQTAHNTVIYDCYNANPSSMRLSLESFAAAPTHLPKTIILGDMLEMGDHARDEHKTIVGSLPKYEFDQVYLVGPEFCAVAGDYPCFSGIDELIENLQANPIRKSYVLIKASKGILYKYDRWEEFDL
jgi:UDP-N-acetylmuramoyl-tripeptide--D-alanyl-D-alanine ligase